jgi:type I restriction enzyme S subunit
MSKELSKYELPKGWIWVTLSDITMPVERVNASHFEGTDAFNYIDIETVNNSTNKLKKPKKYTWNTAPSRAQQIVRKGDILFSTVRPYLKNIAMVSGDYDGCIASSGFCVVRPFVVNPNFLLSYILSQAFVDAVNNLAKGTSYPAVTNKIVLEQSIPLPPLSEQNQIANNIDELFSELDHSVKSLKLAQKQLKVFRQALLKHAFEGKLTKQWRQDNDPEPVEKLLIKIKEERQARYDQEVIDWKHAITIWGKDGKVGKRPFKPKKIKEILNPTRGELLNLKDFPSSWAKIRLEGIAANITDGDHQAPPKSKNGIPFITISNIKENRIDFSKTFYVEDKYYKSLMNYRKPIFGDVLYTVTGSFGIPVLIDFEKEFCFQRHIGLIRPLDRINSRWLFYLLQTKHIYDQAVEKATGTAQKTVGLSSIRSFIIAFCSLTEQKIMVKELDEQFSLIDNLEATINSNLKKSEALRQSIFKKAFEGKLIDQDTNEEPASELLKRIQIEKKIHLEEQKRQRKNAPKKIKKMSKALSIKEVLEASGEPMSAVKVWQESRHKDNIEEFYAELKKIQENIKEVKEGAESLLSLVK